MKAEILINSMPREIRAARIENGVLQELVIERPSHRGLIGNIYKGRVSRVLPGMQAAFIDVGLARTAFLHASDIAGLSDAGKVDGGCQRGIRECVHEGDEILVQVLKDPMGTKGARLTTYMTIPSRFLVMLPNGRGVGVSSRIDDESERERLRELVETISPLDDGEGFIVRTAAESETLDALRADMIFLRKLWEAIEETARGAKAGELVHEDLSLPLRVLRDLLGPDIERIRVDSEPIYRRMREFAERFMPQSSSTIELYGEEGGLFDLYGIEDEIEKALKRKVPLKSGGYLMFDQTEAMTTIDVNTGGFVGHRNLEETIFRTNLEATVAIARQLRLRNLGGIIIIDFIDMSDEEHRRQVLEALSARMASDNSKTQIMDVSPLGLVEMTRKRNRESLEHILCEPCPSCDGRGYVKTAETVCYEIFREILRQRRQFDVQQLMVLAQPDVIERLLDEESAAVAELEELTGTPIRLQSEAMYGPDRFDVILM